MYKLDNPVSFDTLPETVQTILEQVQVINQKIDNLPVSAQEPDENRFVDINEIRQLIFPQWKRQTIYNKCCLGELPYSRIGSRLLFNLKECREWRDSQLQKGKIKSNAQIKDEAQAFFNNQKVKSCANRGQNRTCSSFAEMPPRLHEVKGGKK